ncbi:MAG: glycosyltransferase family 2 protein [Dokdonella sp.]
MNTLAVLIINYRTAEATLACLESLLPELPQRAIVYLLDNASGEQDVAMLRACVDRNAEQIRFDTSDQNLGFAAGMNRLIASAFTDVKVDQVLLLNSDTVATPGFITAMQTQLDPERRVDMIAAKLLHADRDEVESLGITIYRSTLASNRKREDEVLLGPTGGCALLTRRMLDDLLASHGEWFDESFFCYAEDTDLMLRARWLGYLPGYAVDAVVRHRGSLSSGGPDNTFVLYHGIRNSIWWLYKNAPTGWLLRSLPWFITLHIAICLRHLRRGNGRVLGRLYRDAAKGLPKLSGKRRVISRSRRVSPQSLRQWVDPKFYERSYLYRAWKEL